MRELRVSFLHVAPLVCEVDYNRKLLESALRVAANQGAHWVVTPELCIPGYLFQRVIGTDWILPQPDPWMQRFCQSVREYGLTVFLSHPERDPESNLIYNTVFVIDQRGEIIGKHRKIKALRGSEGWSTPGWEIEAIDCDGVKVGVLVCADAYTNDVAQALKDQGAQLLVSPSSWGPGGCGPDGEWEQRTIDTGLPIMVCNRSGMEQKDLDFRRADSVVAHHGQRLLCAQSEDSVVLSFDWDLDEMAPISTDFQRAYLPGAG